MLAGDMPIAFNDGSRRDDNVRHEDRKSIDTRSALLGGWTKSRTRPSDDREGEGEWAAMATRFSGCRPLAVRRFLRVTVQAFCSRLINTTD